VGDTNISIDKKEKEENPSDFEITLPFKKKKRTKNRLR